MGVIRNVATLLGLVALLLVARPLLAASRFVLPILFIGAVLYTVWHVWRFVQENEQAYSPLKYGIGRRVLSDRLWLAEDECQVCEEAHCPGVRKRYAKELVIAGVPVALMDYGENIYCEAHVDRVSDSSKATILELE